MIARWLVPAACAALLLLVSAAPAGSDNDPAGYRIAVPLVLTGKARVKSLALPPSVLAVLQTRDGHDVRVFDAQGRAVPIARAVLRPAGRRDRLAPMPILGAPAAMKISGVELRLDGRGGAQLAELRGEPIAPGRPALLGTLLDARAIKGRAQRLSIDADVPAGQPVTLIVDASDDLRDWRRLGEATRYRRPGEGAPMVSVPLAGGAIDRDYLRITWTASSRLLTAVTVRDAVLHTETGAAPAGATISARAQTPVDAHRIDVAMPFATPVTGLQIVPAMQDGIVPVRILGRDDREQPWALLGQGVANAAVPREIALNGATPRVIRVEADARSTGFTAPPMFRFTLPPTTLLLLDSGMGPFTLAAGRGDARDLFLAADDLLDGQAVTDEVQLSPSAPFRLNLLPPDDAGASWRSMILWAVLLIATTLLAGLAWRLSRQQPAPADVPLV